MVVDHTRGRIERSHLSLAGTARNCAGGATPWGSWLSCEETLAGPEQGFGRNHGYIFEVPAAARGLVEARPLKAMGRFVHEAAAVDSTTGIVYLTEDSDQAMFYRFIPETPGELHNGGRLQALVIRDWPAAQTRNWLEDSEDAAAHQVTTTQTFECDWIDLEEVENPEGDLGERGVAAGAARFCRCEGVAFAQRENGRREIFFAATGGGPKKIGQVWRYLPSPDEGTSEEKASPARLQMVYETHDRAILESCDNLAVAPWGDLIICEDSYDSAPDMRNYIRGMTPDGRLYTLAMNAHPDNGEFCGACFSADGSTLFVNIQRPGLTLAITGPWHSLGERSRQQAMVLNTESV
nr:alkaline phosphatase PhoX [Microbulbifer celer]